jgi:prepilin-type N-terminal cleavage/methylation domain-containing protein
MRDGFTMIELIFVIVVLGILSVVAIPKFIGVAESTNETVCKAFVGTLNRTVSHTIWSSSVLNEPSDYNITVAKLSSNIEPQEECGTFDQYVAAINGTPFTIHIGNNDYNITGTAADKTGPAQWEMALQ